MEKRHAWKTKNGNRVLYSESFRIKVVKEVEHEILSKDAARRKYGIGGKSTVLSWCRKYGREDYPYMAKIDKRKTTRTVDEKDKRIAELEALLAQKQLAVDALESLIEVANEMYDTDIKKKVGLKRFKK
jgi:transposase